MAPSLVTAELLPEAWFELADKVDLWKKKRRRKKKKRRGMEKEKTFEKLGALPSIEGGHHDPRAAMLQWQELQIFQSHIYFL